LPNRIILPKSNHKRRITLVLPTYAPCKIRSIILEKVKGEKPVERYDNFKGKGKPVIFYGSSITQGGCTSRPALAYPQLLSEKIGFDYLNFGISGAGFGEPEMADFISSFNHASLFILDWGANLLKPEYQDLLERRYEPFWRKIHKQNPKTPILFIGLQNYYQELIEAPITRAYIRYKRDFIEKKANEACLEINKTNESSLFTYMKGTEILGLEDIGNTVDGVHPNDLGHKKYAEIIEKKISTSFNFT
ncbi:MAG: hypothetical protein GF364_06205, partial [Candidatus Lokiarchaeota archaeon]|nr:hypothetical protein [Candidatus Lokiarchaeota archaeon]